jgi:hypothetical protein
MDKLSMIDVLTAQCTYWIMFFMKPRHITLRYLGEDIPKQAKLTQHTKCHPLD